MPQSSFEVFQTRLAVEAARDVGHVEAMRQQEERGQKLLHIHHGLCQMLQVHVCHFRRLCASDAIMMLHLKTPEKLVLIGFPFQVFRFWRITSDTAQRSALSLSRAQSLATGPSGKLILYRVNRVSAACSCELAFRATPFRTFLEA